MECRIGFAPAKTKAKLASMRPLPPVGGFDAKHRKRVVTGNGARCERWVAACGDLASLWQHAAGS